MGRPIRDLGLAAALAATLLVAACGQVVTPAAQSTTTAPDPPQDTEVGPPAPSTTAVPYPDLSGVAGGVADAVTAASRGTDVGFVLFDRESGKELASLDRDTPYYTASVVKLLIAIDEVRGTDGGWALPDSRHGRRPDRHAHAAATTRSRRNSGNATAATRSSPAPRA